MEKQVSVPFYVASLHRTFVIGIKYSIIWLHDVLEISCRVDETWQNLDWLQMVHFELKAQRSNGRYKKIFTDGNFVKSVEGIMFMDSAYEVIIANETVHHRTS